MYRIVKSRNLHFVEKRFLWFFWINVSEFGETFEDAEEWIKKAIIREAFDSTQVIRIYERP